MKLTSFDSLCGISLSSSSTTWQLVQNKTLARLELTWTIFTTIMVTIQALSLISNTFLWWWTMKDVMKLLLDCMHLPQVRQFDDTQLSVPKMTCFVIYIPALAVYISFHIKPLENSNLAIDETNGQVQRLDRHSGPHSPDSCSYDCELPSSRSIWYRNEEKTK